MLHWFNKHIYTLLSTTPPSDEENSLSLEPPQFDLAWWEEKTLDEVYRAAKSRLPSFYQLNKSKKSPETLYAAHLFDLAGHKRLQQDQRDEAAKAFENAAKWFKENQDLIAARKCLTCAIQARKNLLCTAYYVKRLLLLRLDLAANDMERAQDHLELAYIADRDWENSTYNEILSHYDQAIEYFQKAKNPEQTIYALTEKAEYCIQQKWFARAGRCWFRICNVYLTIKPFDRSKIPICISTGLLYCMTLTRYGVKKQHECFIRTYPEYAESPQRKLIDDLLSVENDLNQTRQIIQEYIRSSRIYGSVEIALNVYLLK